MGALKSSLLCPPPPRCVPPLRLDVLQLFVNKGLISTSPTQAAFTLMAVSQLSLCVFPGKLSCFDVSGFGVLFGRKVPWVFLSSAAVNALALAT